MCCTPAPTSRGLATCDDGYFDVAQSRRILEAGLAAGLATEIHAHAYSRTGGAELAVSLGAISIDHLSQRSQAEMPPGRGRLVGVAFPRATWRRAGPRPGPRPGLAGAREARGHPDPRRRLGRRPRLPDRRQLGAGGDQAGGRASGRVRGSKARVRPTWTAIADRWRCNIVARQGRMTRSPPAGGGVGCLD